MNIHAIPAFTDNYIWIMELNGKTIVVDPGDASAVKHFISQHGFTIESVLITHWHNDHTAGLQEIKQVISGEVYGPFSDHIEGITKPLKDNCKFSTLGIEFEVIYIPGHTLDHIGFYSKAHEVLFVGDTLFAGGCGRMFEGTPDVFYASLDKLTKLPPSTKVYCTHEYTVANLKFASTVEPENIEIKQRLHDTQMIRKNNKITLPTDMATELATNPFLRTAQPAVIEAALAHGAQSSSPTNVFATLRQWKDNFNG